MTRDMLLCYFECSVLSYFERNSRPFDIWAATVHFELCFISCMGAFFLRNGVIEVSTIKMG